MPFLERDGEYWGNPKNDATAIDELDRLRSDPRASHFIVGWPAFWWFDDYSVFTAHLHENFECVLANEQLVAFDLRTRNQK